MPSKWRRTRRSSPPSTTPRSIRRISRKPHSISGRVTPSNPLAADGRDGLKAFIGFLKEKFPNNRSEIKRIFADGDYVIVHVHAVREPGTRGNAIVDIFNLENGKVVEHWDVIQPVRRKPPTTTACSSGRH